MSTTKDMLIAQGVKDLSLRNRDIEKSWHNTRQMRVLTLNPNPQTRNPKP